MISYENELLQGIRERVEKMQPTQTEIEESRKFVHSSRRSLQEIRSAIEARKERESQLNSRPTERRTGALAEQFRQVPRKDPAQETFTPSYLTIPSAPQKRSSVLSGVSNLGHQETLSPFEETRRRLLENATTQTFRESHKPQKGTGIIANIKARIGRFFKKKR